MLKLRHPASMVIVGPSQCGKTSLVRQLIKQNVHDIKFRKITWCYLYPSSWFSEEPNFEFVKGLPENYEADTLIVIDDFLHHLNEKIADIFVAGCHHRRMSVILILQNLFPRAKVMRDISLNSHYLVLFKNPRDMSQISCLARQLYPQKSKFLTDAFIKATTRPYGYLVCDLHPQTEEQYRLRESFFPDRGIYWIYRPLQ